MSAAGEGLIARAKRFAVPSTARSVWQVGSTVTSIAGLLIALRWIPWIAFPAAAVVLSGLVIRAFVLAHDCGHGALFGSRQANDLAGRWLSAISGIAYEAWKAEHNWHHAHQGKLSHRGFDRYSSPMTEDEARRDPPAAAARARRVRWSTILVIGPFSLLVQRKLFSGWIYSRPGWRWALERSRIERNLAATAVLHAALHVLIAAWAGVPAWIGVFVPTLLLSGAIGSFLFWIQHNHPRTYWAPDETFRFTRVALEGSSYLRLPPLLAWFTADIGIHHVHHLNARIPNYRLEEARRALPELADVAAIGWADVRDSFVRIFWSPHAGRYVAPSELSGSVEGDPAAGEGR